MTTQTANLVGFTGGPLSKDQASAAQQVAHRHQQLATRVVKRELEQRKVNLPLWQRCLAESNRSADRAEEIYTEHRVAQVIKYIESLEADKASGAKPGSPSQESIESLRAENAILLSAQFDSNQRIADVEELVGSLSSQLAEIQKQRRIEAARADNLGKVVGKVGRITSAMGRQFIGIKRSVSQHEDIVREHSNVIDAQGKRINALNTGLQNAQQAFRRLNSRGMNNAPQVAAPKSKPGPRKPTEKITKLEESAVVSELALFSTMLPLTIFFASIIAGAFLGNVIMLAGLAVLCAICTRSLAKMINVIRHPEFKKLKPSAMWGALIAACTHSLVVMFLSLYLGAKLLA